MFRALYISRSLHTMGELVNAGVPMLDTLRITGEISGNWHFRRLWRAVHNSVKQGKKITQPLYQSRLPGVPAIRIGHVEQGSIRSVQKPADRVGILVTVRHEDRCRAEPIV